MANEGVATPGIGDLSAEVSALEQLPPRDSTALVRTVRDRLRLAIALEQIPTGKLNQVQVAKQLGVSRMPIRAAIPELVAEGLLEPLAGGGVAVRELTAPDVRQVYDVRMALETKAVRIVAEQGTDESVRHIQQVVDRHLPVFTSYDTAKLLAADREFHMSILTATDNSHFQRAIVPVWSIVERAMVSVMHIRHVFDSAWHEHAEVARALVERDPDAAEAAMHQHLSRAADKLATSIAESAES
ncbi:MULTISPECIES: GntR family transcriptional regulator [Amycolatopsis methanolica group]|uniref:Transcriptional regulator, GntR family protein n=1 Tax=Amycolatopsis methanolica 239 TaxID=1068978 RepID=A0A076MVQ7_AMYME|nr:GntR family transcriptional regulator [Amycolatopsis methanolica]AIJ24784.1 transcriptional regulator, GntR family protein [Amycolatopsis methanolica 239]